MLIDLISSCNWERPLYVASTMRIEEYLDISRNLVQEGLAQRIVPYDAVAAGAAIDTDKTYRNLMEKFRYGGLDDPDLYLDETNIRMVLSLRRIMTETAEYLYQQGDTLRARACSTAVARRSGIPPYRPTNMVTPTGSAYFTSCWEKLPWESGIGWTGIPTGPNMQTGISPCHRNGCWPVMKSWYGFSMHKATDSRMLSAAACRLRRKRLHATSIPHRLPGCGSSNAEADIPD